MRREALLEALLLSRLPQARQRLSVRGTEHRYGTVVKLEKFERLEAKRCGVTVETLREHYKIDPCSCGKPKCKGWQVRYKFGAERRRLT